MKTQLVKHSATIAMPHKLTMIQQILWNVCIANAYDDLETKSVYYISEKDLLSYFPYKTRNTAYLKESIKVLQTTLVEMNIFGDPRFPKGEWRSFQLLGEVALKEGVCEFQFTPTMRKLLHNPKIYAKVSLLIQQRFRSKHAFALYELIVDKFPTPVTRWYTIEEMREFFGIDPDEYKRVNNLISKVMVVAVDEINKVSDMDVILEKRRTGRSITHVRFHIEKKKNFNMKDYKKIKEGVDANQKKDFRSLKKMVEEKSSSEGWSKRVKQEEMNF